MGKSDGTVYTIDGSGGVLDEVNGATWKRSEMNLGGKHLATVNAAGVVFVHGDWLGTKRYEADGAGNYVNSWASLPFGDNQTALGAGMDATEHHFTGQEHDAESGLDHFAARYYQSQTGRWLLPDWSATPVPVPYAAFTNPQSLNLYTYVGNNPVNAVDADGHLAGGEGSTYTYVQGSAAWDCLTNLVHGAPSDGCDFGGFGVDDGGVQPQAENAMVAQQQSKPIHIDHDPNDPNYSVEVHTDACSMKDPICRLEYEMLMRYFKQRAIALRNQSIYSLSQEQRIRQIALVQPTLCGGGAFAYGGRSLDVGPANGFVGGIIEADSNTGISKGAIFEGGGGEGIVGGGGLIVSSNGNGLVRENLAFGGPGIELPGAHASTGFVGFTTGLGVYGDISGGGREVGVGVYLNITTNAGCMAVKR